MRNLTVENDNKSGINSYKGEFENLKMKEEENIALYILRVDEIVNVIRGIGGEIKEKDIVDKVLRTLPMRYDSKVSSLEEQDDLKLMTVDELHGIFTSYEMRTRQNGSSKKEAAFKSIS